MRGRTRPGRLRLLDAWLTALPSPDLVVDVGLGDDPATTVELFEALSPLRAEVIGFDADASRVERARAAERPGLSFRRCENFDLGLPRAPSLIRAVNLLRGDPLEAARAGTAKLAAQLAEGGLLLEGSTDVGGALGCVQLWRKRSGAVVDEGLLFFTDFSRGFAPRMFRDVLPRVLRRSVKPGTAIHAFLGAWQGAFDAGRAPGEAPAAAFERSGRALPSAQLDLPQRLRWAPGTPTSA